MRRFYLRRADHAKRKSARTTRQREVIFIDDAREHKAERQGEKGDGGRGGKSSDIPGYG